MTQIDVNQVMANYKKYKGQKTRVQLAKEARKKKLQEIYKNNAFAKNEKERKAWLEEKERKARLAEEKAEAERIAFEKAEEIRIWNEEQQEIKTAQAEAELAEQKRLEDMRKREAKAEFETWLTHSRSKYQMWKCSKPKKGVLSGEYRSDEEFGPAYREWVRSEPVNPTLHWWDEQLGKVKTEYEEYYI